MVKGTPVAKTSMVSWLESRNEKSDDDRRKCPSQPTDLSFIYPLMVKLIFAGSSKRNRFTAHDLTTSLALSFMSQELSLAPLFCPPERERYVKKKVKGLKYGFPRKL